MGFKIEPGPALKIFVGKIEAFTGGKPPEEPNAATQPKLDKTGAAGAHEEQAAGR